MGEKERIEAAIASQFSYEVLRARNMNYREPLLVYDRNDATEHYTTHGLALRMVEKYLKDNSRGGGAKISS